MTNTASVSHLFRDVAGAVADARIKRVIVVDGEGLRWHLMPRGSDFAPQLFRNANLLDYFLNSESWRSRAGSDTLLIFVCKCLTLAPERPSFCLEASQGGPPRSKVNLLWLQLCEPLLRSCGGRLCRRVGERAMMHQYCQSDDLLVRALLGLVCAGMRAKHKGFVEVYSANHIYRNATGHRETWADPEFLLIPEHHLRVLRSGTIWGRGVTETCLLWIGHDDIRELLRQAESSSIHASSTSATPVPWRFVDLGSRRPLAATGYSSFEGPLGSKLSYLSHPRRGELLRLEEIRDWHTAAHEGEASKLTTTKVSDAVSGTAVIEERTKETPKSAKRRGRAKTESRVVLSVGSNNPSECQPIRAARSRLLLSPRDSRSLSLSHLPDGTSSSSAALVQAHRTVTEDGLSLQESRLEAEWEAERERRLQVEVGNLSVAKLTVAESLDEIEKLYPELRTEDVLSLVLAKNPKLRALTHMRKALNGCGVYDDFMTFYADLGRIDSITAVSRYCEGSAGMMQRVIQSMNEHGIHPEAPGEEPLELTLHDELRAVALDRCQEREEAYRRDCMAYVDVDSWLASPYETVLLLLWLDETTRRPTPYALALQLVAETRTDTEMLTASSSVLTRDQARHLLQVSQPKVLFIPHRGDVDGLQHGRYSIAPETLEERFAGYTGPRTKLQLLAEAVAATLTGPRTFMLSLICRRLLLALGSDSGRVTQEPFLLGCPLDRGGPDELTLQALHSGYRGSQREVAWERKQTLLKQHANHDREFSIDPITRLLVLMEDYRKHGNMTEQELIQHMYPEPEVYLRMQKELLASEPENSETRADIEWAEQNPHSLEYVLNHERQRLTRKQPTLWPMKREIKDNAHGAFGPTQAKLTGKVRVK